MDDNIINVNILNLYRNDKIIYYPVELKNINDINNSWQWWNRVCGKPAIRKLLENNNFKHYNINKFNNVFADWLNCAQARLRKTRRKRKRPRPRRW
jgi:hypothetical protein